MNLSRLAVLAVFFMMVMSAFVTIPTYNVGADEHGDGGDNGDDHGDECPFDEDNPDSPCNVQECEDHESQECHDYVDNYCANNDDPGCEAMNMDMVCYDISSHTIDFDITNEEDCVDAGFMWVSPNSGPNDGDDHDDDWNLESLNVKVQMESLEEWLVMIEGQHSVEHSDDMRNEIAYQCSEMMGTSNSEITAECFSHFIEMMANDDDHGDHGDHGDHHGCPPDMSDETCEQWEDCDDNGMNMSCMRIMYDYCETSSHCSNDPNETPDDCYDDDGEPCGPNVVYMLFAYEDGEMTAEDFVDSMMDSFGMDHGSDGGHDDHDDCDYYYGEDEDRCEYYENPGLYQMNTIVVDVDQEVTIHANFENTPLSAPSFICGDGTEIAFYHVNNNTVDCEDGADEQWYDSNTPDDTSDDCQEAVDEDCEGDPVNWFDCHDGTQIWIYQVNNWDWDCSDGEDESSSHDSWNYWHGDIYLLEGEYDYIPGHIDLTPDEVFAVQVEYCEWEDTNKTNVECDDYIRADLVSNQVYTLVTTTDCYQDWDSYYLDCENFGIYNHTMVYDDGSVTGIAGEIYSSPYGYCGGCWDPDGEGNFVQDSAANFTYDLRSDDDSYSNFVLYHAETFVVGADGFEGYLVSSSYTCDRHNDDDEIEHCWGGQQEMYLYDAFDTTDTFSGIMNISEYDYNEDWDCDVDYCHFSHMNLELDEGDYVIVTTTDGDDYGNTVVNNTIFDTAGSGVTSWNLELHNAYYEYDGEERTLVTGDDRLYFIGWMNWYMDNYYDHDHDDHDDHDDHYHVMMALMENFTAYEENTYTEVEVADNLVEIMYMMDEIGMFGDDHDDHDDHMSLSYFDVSSWDSTNDLQMIVDWFNDEYHYDENDSEMTVDEFLSMCEGISDDVNEEVAQCVLDKALSMMPDHDDHDDHGDHDDHDDHGDHDDHDDHGDHDDHDHGDHDDGDDNALLDGIVGVQDPEDGDCVISSTNMVGNVSDNEGLPMLCSFEFKIRYEGVDSSKMQHEAHIPFEDGEYWSLEFVMLEGYEFISCDNCDVDANGIMTGTGPVTVTFGKIVEPQVDCDHVVGLDATGMAFDPIKLSIKVGETVCWQWTDAAMAHNVLELEGEYDSTMNLTNVNFGFSSGAPAVTVDFRHTFTKDNMTHYYVCEPHATTGMVGQITVGAGSADDPVQETIEDNEVPSVGFVVGSLVLVGAAGLRRRIH